LTEDFARGGTDFYTVAAERMLGRPPENRTERDFFKQTILSVVNGKSAVGLAKTLRIIKDQATDLLRKFATAYPEVDCFTRTMHEAIAITGTAETFGGRQRRVTPHWWMVENSEVELFVSYRGADKLWLRVVPLRPSRHTLTCYVLSVVDAGYNSPRRDQEIYHHRDGRISQAPYRFFNDTQLVWGLPVRNISWRLIRRVRTLKEEARYEGFDRTRRQLFNLVCQGGTADLVRLMMVRSQPVCTEFGAKLLLQIHDELVFEVPEVRMADFVRVMQPVLEQRPTPDFAVPIVVEPKVGTKFGEMRDFETQ
jgi:DNA polymerase I-like protein with 3'-5' exonuclease and polymerase domains